MGLTQAVQALPEDSFEIRSLTEQDEASQDGWVDVNAETELDSGWVDVKCGPPALHKVLYDARLQEDSGECRHSE